MVLAFLMFDIPTPDIGIFSDHSWILGNWDSPQTTKTTKLSALDNKSN